MIRYPRARRRPSRGWAPPAEARFQIERERWVTDTADVVVVGGGVNGVSIAYALAARGVGNVVLCE